jgi:hypothetical protein
MDTSDWIGGSGSLDQLAPAFGRAWGEAIWGEAIWGEAVRGDKAFCGNEAVTR